MQLAFHGQLSKPKYKIMKLSKVLFPIVACVLWFVQSIWENKTLKCKIFHVLLLLHSDKMSLSDVMRILSLRRSRFRNPLKPCFFFQASLFQLLKLEIHCEDHISPSYISAVHI